MNIVFAHPRFEYGSYVDYRALVRVSGFRSCFFDEIDLRKDETVYIVSPANHSLYESLERFSPSQVRSKVIFWNLEDPNLPTAPIQDLKTTEVHASSDSIFVLPGVTYGWTSNRTLPVRDSRYRFVPMGSHPGIVEEEGRSSVWDLSHMSYVWGRRGPILDRLSQKFRVAPASFGRNRALALAGSRAIYCVHQREGDVLVEPLRLALAAAYALPYLTEVIDDGPGLIPESYPVRAGVDYLSFDYKDVVDGVTAAMQYPNLGEMGRNLHKRLAVEFSFERCVSSALREMFR